MSGSGISWAICKSAPHPRYLTTPASHHSVFLQAECPSCCPTNSVKALQTCFVLLWPFQKAIKTADDTSKQKSRTSSAKQQHQRVDRGAAGDSRKKKSFVSHNVFPSAPTSAQHTSTAGPAARDEGKMVSCFHQEASCNCKNGLFETVN